VFEELDLTLSPGSCVGLLGTQRLRKNLADPRSFRSGEDKPDRGHVFHYEDLAVAYFEQDRGPWTPTKPWPRPRSSWRPVIYRGTPLHIRSYLDRFLFTKLQTDMPVAKLSGGEQSRLLIAKLMLVEANVLVLDEPTNDLDLATLNILQSCLEDFKGAILLVTHDRYFLDAVCNQILAFPFDDESSRRLVSFADLANGRAGAKRGVLRRNQAAPTSIASQFPPTSAKPKKRSYKDQLEFDAMEGRIHEAESQLAVLNRRPRKTPRMPPV
jgi:ATP-binding cassette subfamily F protein uup